jgi:hypothetical protein
MGGASGIRCCNRLGEGPQFAACQGVAVTEGFRSGFLPNGRKIKTKYAPIGQHLSSLQKTKVSLTFSAIEEVLGFELPDSARNHDAWWDLAGGHTHVLGWVGWGWEVSVLDRVNGHVTFFRYLSLSENRESERLDQNIIEPRETKSTTRKNRHFTDLQLDDALSEIRGKKAVVLIACCKSKLPGGESFDGWSGFEFSKQVDQKYKLLLQQTRKELAPLAGARFGPELGGADVGSSYRAAIIRYKGTVYAGMPARLWPKIGDDQLIIISALYGPIFAWEQIQDYELTMGHKTATGHRVSRVWRDVKLGGWLADWLLANQVDVVVDLLSLKYRHAVEGYEQFGGKVLPISCPRKGIGSQFDRRGYLEAVLESIKGPKDEAR